MQSDDGARYAWIAYGQYSGQRAVKPFVRFYLASFYEHQKKISRQCYMNDCLNLICRQLGAKNLPTYNDLYKEEKRKNDYATDDDVVRILKDTGIKAR